MNDKVRFRLKDIEVKGYYFIAYEGLYWHSGHFWFNEEKVKQVENNGSLSILLYGTSKKSVKKLRAMALPCTIKLLKEKMPF
jgi:hypothetical protein